MSITTYVLVEKKKISAFLVEKKVLYLELCLLP